MTNVFSHLMSSSRMDGRFYGVAIGVVTNNRDPEGLGRVRVRLPWMGEHAESNWARVAAPMAGNGRGCYFLPEVDDEVLVAFEHGSPEFPYVLGGLWNGKDKPPADNGDGKNNIRVITSRSGHVIRLTDKKGAEQIEIIDSSAKNSIVINTKDNSITITANSDIAIKAGKGKISLSGKNVEITAQEQVKINADGQMALESNATLNVKGKVVNIN